MKKIVLMSGPDGIKEEILINIRLMFPECEIQVVRNEEQTDDAATPTQVGVASITGAGNVRGIKPFTQ